MGRTLGLGIWGIRWCGVLICTGALASCSSAAPQPEPQRDAPAKFVGSAACQSCHRDIYDRWKDTLMANVIRDPREHPDAILADFSTPNPLVTFTKEDVAFTYGTKWKQRYFTKIGDDFFVFPPEDHWLHDVEIEGSLDYVATGLPEGAPRWSFSLVFVVPVVRGR